MTKAAEGVEEGFAPVWRAAKQVRVYMVCGWESVLTAVAREEGGDNCQGR